MKSKNYMFGNLDTKNKDEIQEMEKKLIEKYNSVKKNEKTEHSKSNYISA